MPLRPCSLRFMVLTLVTVLLVSCSSSGDQTQMPEDQIVLQFWTFSDYATGPGGDLMREFVAEFEAANPGISVELIGKPDTEIQAGVIAGASADELPDLFNAAYNAGYEVTKAGAVQDVSALWNALPEDYRAQFSPAAVEGLQANGKMYGIPYTLYSVFLYRNLTVLREAGIDPIEPIDDWDEWLGQMQQVNEAGYLALPNYTVDGWLVMNFLAGIEGIHNDVVDGQWTVSADQLAKAYTFLASARQYGSEISPGDAAATDLFITNQMAFYVMGPWSNPTFAQAAENAGLEYDFVLLPGETTTHTGGLHGGEFIAIAPGPDAESAFRFATFLADKAQMVRFATTLGRANFNVAAMTEENVQDQPLVALTGQASNAGMADAAYFQPFPLAIRQPLTDYAIAVAEGRMSPDQAANAAVEEINAILALE